jgi:hypothetical protein
MCIFLGTNSLSQLQVTFSGDTTKIWDRNILWYCEAKFTMIVTRVGDSITVVERDTMPPVRCMCYFTVCANIIGLPSGNYTAHVKRHWIFSLPEWSVDSTMSIGTITFSVNTGSAGDLLVKSYQSGCSQIPVKFDQKTERPNSFYLLTNYPNPFNPLTIIHYAIPKSTELRIAVYDIHGSLVKILLDKYSMAGEYYLSFDGSGLSSGMYFVRMTNNQTSLENKIVLIK